MLHERVTGIRGKNYELRNAFSEVSPTVKFEMNIYLSIKYLESSAFGFLDPDEMVKISTKNYKKNLLLP